MAEEIKMAEIGLGVESKALSSTQIEGERQHKEKKKKRSYSSRSRSHQSRSRSKEGKKHKNKHKSKKSRSRSRDKDIRRDRYHDSNYRDNRDRKDHRDHGKERDRDRPKEREKDKKKEEKLLPTEIPMPLPPEIMMPSVPGGQKRKRERSRSPLGYYRRNQNNKDGQFWDSFSWVPRMNFLPTVSSSALANTKKMRRLLITNIPFQIGITEQDLRNLITRFMAQNYLKDEMNSCPVVNLEINQPEKNAAVQLSSVEQTCRICKLQKIQLFKGIVNGIIRLGDSCYGNNVVTQAQTAAQAQAAAFAAINVLENKRTNFSVDNLRNNNNLTSTVLRVTEAVTSYMAGQLSKEQWSEYEQDLIEGFSQFGTIVHHWFVKKDERDICADPGNLFVEYESKMQAEKAMSEMQGRAYDERNIQIYYVPRELYYQNYQKKLTPPAIKDKK